MRLATHTFLWSFIPIGGLLAGSFWTIQNLLQNRVREELRASLREKELAIAQLRSRTELQNSRFLKMVGENAALKAGLQLLLINPGQTDARLTVEDQLRDICSTLGFDLMMVSTPSGDPLAGVVRMKDQLAPLTSIHANPPARGLFTIEGRTYQIASTPIAEAEETLGILSLGQLFDFDQFNIPAVLLHNGTIVRSNVPHASWSEIERAFRGCAGQGPCELHVKGDTFLSLPMESIYFGDGYSLRTLQSLNAAMGPIRTIIGQAFGITGLGAFVAAFVLAAFSSRSALKPVAEIMQHLQQSEVTGVLVEFDVASSRIEEMRRLMESFNRAAAATREAREHLHRAYLQFVESLASALDARDPYTAGHGRRVSDLSCAIASALHLADEDVDRIRIGALLHDIGKIGIPDAVLQKPSSITAEEFALIREHPRIGRAILEGVRGFQPYLPIVELHHENWDGTGYPHGLLGAATPLDARIVHVADAYDAMTSDRPYRRGMSHEKALAILQANRQTQFDASIVNTLAALPQMAVRPSSVAPPFESELAFSMEQKS